MKREEALETLGLYIKNPFLIKHHLAAEAAMRGLASYFIKNKDSSIDVNTWGIVGLLHDADYELTRDTPEQHTMVLAEKLGNNVSLEVMHAIQSHNYKRNNIMPESLMDWAITCCDELTGLIISATLIHPDKKIASLDVDFVLKRFNEKSFSKAVERDQILLCEEKLGLALPNFIEIVLKSMQGIANDLGL